MADNSAGQSKTPQAAVIYVRLSDTKDDAAGALSLADQEARARARADSLGWTVARVVMENDLTGSGRRSNASAYKQRKVTHADGRVTYEDRRPRWREVLAALATGANDGLIVLDLDRAIRRLRSAQDLIDVNRATGVPIESATGSLRIYGPEDYDQATIIAWAASKSSADTARRVSAARQRQRKAGTWGGGTRPYGFTTTETPGQLATVPEEAEVIGEMVSGVVAGRTLWAIAAELRERGVPTAQGKEWTPEGVRQTVLREMTADVVSDREEWETAVRVLTNPARRSSPGNKSKWLGSGVFRCGRCGGVLHARARRGAHNYYCRAGHVQIDREAVDREVTATVIARLARPDAAGLLAEPATPTGTDPAALARQAGRLRQRKAMLAGLLAAGEMDAEEWAAASRVVKDQLAALDTALAAAAGYAASAPAATLAGREDAARVWDGMDVEAQRAVLRSLVDVTVAPQGRGVRAPDWRRGESYRWFNPERVQITWRAEAGEEASKKAA